MKKILMALIFSFTPMLACAQEIVTEPVVKATIVSQVAGLPFGELLIGLSLLVTFFSGVALITPWKWDNKLLNFLQKIVNVLSLAKKNPNEKSK